MEFSRARAEELMEGSRKQRILVAGGLMFDQYVYGDVTRICPEAPVPVACVQGELDVPVGERRMSP